MPTPSTNGIALPAPFLLLLLSSLPLLLQTQAFQLTHPVAIRSQQPTTIRTIFTPSTITRIGVTSPNTIVETDNPNEDKNATAATTTTTTITATDTTTITATVPTLDEIEKAVAEAKNGYDTSADYSQFLYTKSQKKRNQQRLSSFRNAQQQQQQGDVDVDVGDDEDNEDGYAVMMKKERPLWKRLLLVPVQISMKLGRTVTRRYPEPGTLILVRHGESEWNANKTFTGWADPALSDQGVRETEHAARLLLAGGYEIDVVFTSRLKRAILSTWIILGEMNQLFLPVFKSWRLNERMYGALTGLCKFQTAEQMGADVVQSWRGSLRSKPPSLTMRDKYWPGRDRRYSDLSSDQIPLTESLLDCMSRTEPVWEDKIKFELQMGRNVMVVAHANTLRGLVKLIDGIGDQEIQEVGVPTGIPIVYKFDRNMNPVKPKGKHLSQNHMTGVFLEKPGVLNAALQKEKQWVENVPGYNKTMTRSSTGMSSLERSLSKLNAEKELRDWADQFIDPDAVEDDGSDGNQGKPIAYQDDGTSKKRKEPRTQISKDIVPALISSMPCMQSMPSQSVIPGFGDVPVRKDAVVVLIRHGKTEHNKLGLFTGWEDAPLAKEGKEEAKRAGQLLKAHGFEFDVVYTSWLSRAIETAWLVIDEMDAVWLPIIKTWRLNERMYGALTGKSKAMIAQKYGEKQFKAWRRGYKVKPPPVSSFSVHYPGNDARYKHLNDIRISISETVMRTFDSGKISIYRKLPKSESLKNCMDRTIPYYEQQIVPNTINNGKRVLISSSENAIRGLLMTLCDIPQEKISELEIPNGIPIIYDVKSRCIKLLDDGSGKDPLEVYNFGKAAEYLFRPCVNEDGEEEECDITYMSDAVLSMSDSDVEFTRSLRPNSSITAN